MLKVVDVCSRVEGHGGVKILLQNDEVSSVEFEITAFRGFENILIGKRLIEIPRIASRICGLCHASQSIVSCKAIESIFNIELSEQMVLLRRILLTGELIKSHIMHYFFQFFPDLLDIFNYSKKTLSPYELIKYDPQLTTNIYELIKFGNELDKMFGGRSVHLINAIPGGVIYKPSRKKITTAKRYLMKAQSNIEYIIDHFINHFAEKKPPSEFSLPDNIKFGLHFHGAYDRYKGLLRLQEMKSKPIDFQITNYSRYLDKDSNLRGINFKFKEKNVLVGPLARNNIVESYGFDEPETYLESFNNEWKKSVLYTKVLSLIEIYVEVKQALKIMENSILNKKDNLAVLKKIENHDGIGVIEAPRGTLMHHYHIDDNKIVKEVKLFIATEINIPIINEMITRHAQQLYEKTGDINLVKKDVQKIIRAFDPCISCATH